MDRLSLIGLINIIEIELSQNKQKMNTRQTRQLTDQPSINSLIHKFLTDSSLSRSNDSKSQKQFLRQEFQSPYQVSKNLQEDTIKEVRQPIVILDHSSSAHSINENQLSSKYFCGRKQMYRSSCKYSREDIENRGKENKEKRKDSFFGRENFLYEIQGIQVKVGILENALEEKEREIYEKNQIIEALINQKSEHPSELLEHNILESKIRILQHKNDQMKEKLCGKRNFESFLSVEAKYSSQSKLLLQKIVTLEDENHNLKKYKKDFVNSEREREFAKQQTERACVHPIKHLQNNSSQDFLRIQRQNQLLTQKIEKSNLNERRLLQNLGQSNSSNNSLTFENHHLKSNLQGLRRQINYLNQVKGSEGKILSDREFYQKLVDIIDNKKIVDNPSTQTGETVINRFISRQCSKQFLDNGFNQMAPRSELKLASNLKPNENHLSPHYTFQKSGKPNLLNANHKNCRIYRSDTELGNRHIVSNLKSQLSSRNHFQTIHKRGISPNNKQNFKFVNFGYSPLKRTINTSPIKMESPITVRNSVPINSPKNVETMVHTTRIIFQ